MGFEQALSASGLEPSLINLMYLRASQINGCAYCIDMHWKDLRAAGENEQRLYELAAWRESPFYSDRERAALAWTEAVTLIADGHVPDAVFDEVRQQFKDSELAYLTLAVVAINGWNRFNIAFRTVPAHTPPANSPRVPRAKRADGRSASLTSASRPSGVAPLGPARPSSYPPERIRHSSAISFNPTFSARADREDSACPSAVSTRSRVYCDPRLLSRFLRLWAKQVLTNSRNRPRSSSLQEGNFRDMRKSTRADWTLGGGEMLPWMVKTGVAPSGSA